MRTSVVMPIREGASFLNTVGPSWTREMEEWVKRWGGGEWVLVDDGSADSTYETIHGMASTCRAIRGIRLGRPVGQHPATLAGLRVAGGPRFVVLDGDGQYGLDTADAVARTLDQGYDCVIGKRGFHGGTEGHAGAPGRSWAGVADPVFRGIIRIMIRAMTGVRLSDPTCSIKGFGVPVRDRLLELGHFGALYREFSRWRVGEAPVSQRPGRTSRYTGASKAKLVVEHMLVMSKLGRTRYAEAEVAETCGTNR